MVVSYVNKFKKELKDAPTDIQKRVAEVIVKLKAAETLESSGVDYKRMAGQKKGGSYYRIRLGGWRMGIEYIHPDIVLLTMMSRGDIYKHFPPK